MIKLFFNRDNIRAGVTVDPTYSYVKRTYSRELDTIRDYYKSRVMTVKNEHLLVRIIETVVGNVNGDLYDYMDNVEARGRFVASNFGLTNGRNKGVVHDDIFYGKGSKELILSISESIDIENSINNWMRLEPVKVLRHNNTDLNFMLPTNLYDRYASELSVFSIDIPLLAVQYREWYLAKRATGIMGPVAEYVHMFVLPGMLSSQSDMVLFNRLERISNKEDMDDSIGKHKFPVVDYSRRLDKVLGNVIKTVSNKKIRYADVLKNVPSISHGNMYESLMLPDYIRNRQTRWVTLMSRLNVIMFLLNTCGPKAYSVNKDLINDIQIYLTMISRDSLLEDALKKQGFLLDTIELDLDFILNI